VETTGRRTVYLDINHWYALGEAMAGRPQKPEHVDVLHQLVRLVGQGRIMIPLPAVNYIELSENPRDHQREQAAKAMTLLARFSTITIESNFVQALLNAGYSMNRRPPLRDRESLTTLLTSMPSRRVATMLQYHYLKDSDKHWKISDLRDNTALAVTIPYCDIVVTDSAAWNTAVNHAHLDMEFGTAIFRSLTDLAARLN